MRDNNNGQNESGGSQTAERKNSFLTRDGKLILLSVLLNTIPIGFMNVIPAVYLLEVGYSASIVGAIYAASAISNTLANTPFGILADRFGRKMFFFIGSLVPAISYIIFARTLNAYWLIVASLIGGVGVAGGIAFAISGTALLPLLANATSDKNRTSLFGANQGMWATAATVGALLSYIPGLLIRYLGETSFGAHATSYYLMAFLAMASAVPVIFIKEEKGKQISRENFEAPLVERRSLIPLVPALQESGRREYHIRSVGIIAKLSLVYALAGLGLGVIVQLLASWYHLQFGVSESTAGLWIGIAEVATIPTILAIPKLVRRRGTLTIAVAFGAISALFLGLMPLTGIFVLAAILFALRNVFVNISWPVLLSYTMGVVDEKERATATGITATAWGITNAVGTLIGGSLLASKLLYFPFVIGVAAYLGSSIALWFFFKGVKPPEETIISKSES